MADKRYVITRSNFTLREKHKGLKNGNTIYERDYMTTTNLGGWDSGSIPYGESNFKFVHNQNDNTKKSFKNGKWLEHDGSTVWTLGDVAGTQPKEESNVVIKPNKNSFRDYAYFGSCVELLRVSLENIIKFYPGELYVTDRPYIYTNQSGSTETLGYEAFNNPVEIYNPFSINISKTNIPSDVLNDEDFNPLRYFATSLNKYALVTTVSGQTDSECFSNWDVTTKNKKCYKTGEFIDSIVLTTDSGDSIEIREYYFDTGNILITEGTNSGKRIRPMDKYIEEVFSTKFSQFDNFLLNRDSKPIYTIDIDVPTETDDGISVTRTEFTFPVLYGWNLDVKSGRYTKYTNDLLHVAEFYDTHYSNNLWENIVHESIKNMDSTFSNPSKDEDISDYRLGIGNIHGLMLAYARQFDDIKLSIENIKSSNVVTYNENNNIPDYLLSDTLGLSGWEVSSAVKTLDETAKVGNLFSGSTAEYTTEELNTTFMRNLKINSRAIFSHKGNRQGIEMLLALFGFASYEYGRNYYNCLPESSKITSGGRTLSWDELSEEDKSKFYDYKFNEYVTVAKNKPEDVILSEDTLCVEDINQQIKGDAVLSVVNGVYDEAIEIVNPLVGLPVRMVYLSQDNGSGETMSLKYIIPWFDKTTEYDGKTYFQMYGGWEKIEDSEGSQYSETLKYLNIVGSIGELALLLQSKLRDGDIYYVTDITDYKQYYPEHDPNKIPSHYFYLQNPAKSYQYSENGDGWQIITQAQVDNREMHGAKVYELENIINDYTGNNPHVGYGKYDDGDKYLQRISHIFDGAFDDGYFDDCEYTCNGSAITKQEIYDLGFELTDKLVDNVKCWYFVDSINTNDKPLLDLKKKYTTIVDGLQNEYEVVDGYEESQCHNTIKVGENAYNSKDVHLSSNLTAFNLENQQENSVDEAAANSVVNIKNITLEFNKTKYNVAGFDEYLREVVLFYLNQVIPTTSILTIKYIGNNEFDTCMSSPVVTGVS